MRRTRPIVAIVTLVSTLVATPAWSQATAQPRDVSNTCPSSGTDFPDTAGSVHAQNIRCIRDLGITVGRSDGTYNPTGNVTMGQLATFAIRTLEAADVAVPPTAPDFYTNDNGTPHEASLNRLAVMDIYRSGRSTIDPNETVTRARMAHVVNRAARAAGVAAPASQNAFADDNGDVYENDINAIFADGIISGRTDGTYGASELVRRDQMATFLARTYDLLEESTTTTPNANAAIPGQSLPQGRAVGLDWWDVQVTDYVADANSQVTESSGNAAAENGGYAMVTVTATYRGRDGVPAGEDARNAYLDFSLYIEGMDQRWTDLNCNAEPPNSMVIQPDARRDQTVTGTFCFDAPAEARNSSAVYISRNATGQDTTAWSTS